jgi:hypothetical protein
VGACLFDGTPSTGLASAGEAASRHITRHKYAPAMLAWDFASVALSAVVADTTAFRSSSPDGWTRELELDVAVSDPDLWNTVAQPLTDALNFLTTDRWSLHFTAGARHPSAPKKARHPDADAVTLLSGGLDSLVGAIDLSNHGVSLLAVSQTVRGDRSRQAKFAATIGDGLDHLALNHNASPHRAGRESSQRARSLAFIAFGVLAASSLQRYAAGERVTLHLCENGFIAINPSLTPARLGSLSTRTAHPEFLGAVQQVLDRVGMEVAIRNPYRKHTKGEILRDCADQALLSSLAAESNSCGRFQRYGYRHCGRCVPCQVRRAAFFKWDVEDFTDYVYNDLGHRDENHAAFDDVRSVAMAIASVEADGIDRWLGPSLSSPKIDDRDAIKAMLGRGLDELAALHRHFGVS